MSLRFEDNYIGEIVEKVVAEIGAFKRPPSMLLLGGGQWRFGRLVGKQVRSPPLRSVPYGTAQAWVP